MAAAQTSPQTSKGLLVRSFDCLGLPPLRGKVNSRVQSQLKSRYTGAKVNWLSETAPTATHLSTQVSPSHAQALEASPFRALTRTNPTDGTPRPHHPPAPSGSGRGVVLGSGAGSGRGVSAPNGSGRPEPAHQAPRADTKVCAWPMLTT
eukprot:scaffold74626_cov65-Phaeocystis_antarctica.AAC.3